MTALTGLRAGAVRPDYDKVLVLKELDDAPVLQSICHDFNLEQILILCRVVQ
jgi:hypothetical protein